MAEPVYSTRPTRQSRRCEATRSGGRPASSGTSSLMSHRRRAPHDKTLPGGADECAEPVPLRLIRVPTRVGRVVVVGRDAVAGEALPKLERAHEPAVPAPRRRTCRASRRRRLRDLPHAPRRPDPARLPVAAGRARSPQPARGDLIRPC
jgi:hypothetical protein